MPIKNTTIPNVLYPVANAGASDNAFVDVFNTRDPTVNDVQYPVQKKWLNTSTNGLWELLSFVSSAGVVTANWQKIASGVATTETLTGNSGGAVPPTANNINVLGDGTFITTVGTPGTSTLTIEPAGGLATVYTENTGTAVPSGGNLNIVGGTGVTTTGAGNTVTISLTGSGGAVESFQVDAHTAPGTNPVLPTAGGLVTVTGGQVAAGTTTNVIRTDSLAANTYTIEVQRSQAVASSTVGDNGVSHFSSNQFAVDGNGFVTLAGGSGPPILDFIVQTGTSPVVPSSGAVTFNGAVVSAGTHPVRTDGTGANTMALEVQISQAIASTDATKIGLSAFDSAFFSVDANGFVTAATPVLGIAYTNVNHAASPYTVLSTDYYISVDCSGGTVTLNFPNAPTAKRLWVIKDRTGSASTNNITLTTPGGTVTFDGLTSYIMNSNYQAINLLANATPTYEVY